MVDVTCFVEDSPGNIGIFGKFSSVTFELSATPVSIKVQNLVTEETVNITDKSTLASNLRIPGKILEEINGISANKPAVRLIVTY